jgi:ABC-type branched-subunit amino acid transport system substrate-binding protein
MWATGPRRTCVVSYQNSSKLCFFKSIEVQKNTTMALKFNPSRRTTLRTTSLWAATSLLPALAQPKRAETQAKSITIVQFADMSAGQIDVSKDFVIGSRAAWQEINLTGGVRGRAVMHRVIEVDGTDAGLRSAISAIEGQAGVVACMGTVGAKAAVDVAIALQREAPDLPHIAPWLPSSKLDATRNTFAIFASRQAQISHAVRSLSVMGVPELGAVYATKSEFNSHHAEIESVASQLKIRLKAYGPAPDLSEIAQTLTADSPRVLVFLGGTPELMQLSQAIEKQGALRYIIAMSDVNLLTLSQMGKSQHARVIATQVVPLVNSNIPMVRQYRESLTKLFDEPPTPQGLAGYLSARYTHQAMLIADTTPSRQSLLQTLQRRVSSDIAGFRIDLTDPHATGTFVTQSMLSTDGRIVG